MRNPIVVPVAVPLALLLGGCAGGTSLQPVDISAPAPAASPAVTMECVTREMENIGYEVTPASSTPTRVTGVRINEKPWFLRWIYGNTADQLTASIENGQLRITAVSSDPNSLGDDGPPTSGASENATRNARSILGTCS